MSAVDIMSEVTPGVDCFAGTEGWLAVGAGAGAFAALFAFDAAAATGGAVLPGRAAAFTSAPFAMYGCPAGVIAGSWFASLVAGCAVLEALAAAGAVRDVLGFPECCRK